MKKMLYLCSGATTMYDSQIAEQLRQFEEYLDVTKVYLVYRHQYDKIKNNINKKDKVIFLDKSVQFRLFFGLFDLDLNLQSYDFIYCRGYFSAQAGISIKRKNNLKALIVSDLRASILDELAHQKGWYNYVKSKIYKNVEKNIIKYSDFIFVVSRNFKDYLEKVYGCKYANKLIAMRPFINPDKFKYSELVRINMRKKLGYKNNDKVLIYCGGVSWWQCIDEMINMFTELNKLSKNIKLIVLTNDIDKIKADYSELINGVDDFKLLSVPNEEVINYLCAADYGVLLRKKALTNYVAYPTKFSEYLLSGLRVITTKNIGSYMDANKYNSILVDVDNIDYKDVFNQINKKFSSRKEIRRNYVEVLYNKQIHELFKK